MRTAIIAIAGLALLAGPPHAQAAGSGVVKGSCDKLIVADRDHTRTCKDTAALFWMDNERLQAVYSYNNGQAVTFAGASP